MFLYTFVPTIIVCTTMDIESSIKNTVPLSPHAKAVINVLYTSRHIEECSALMFKSYDLTAPQFNVLRILRGQKGRPAQLSTIQERMIDKNSNTSRLIDKLVAKDWVTRRICRENRRKIEIFITPNGLDKLTEVDPLVEQTNTQLLKDLTLKEMEQLNMLLDKLRTK